MASGRINGTTTGNSAKSYDFWVEWSSTAYASGNYSIINATAYLKRNDGYANSAYNLNIEPSSKYITVAGTKKTSTEKGIDTRNSKKVIIASVKNLKVVHNSDGYKTINISATFPRLTDNLTGGNLSKNVSLDKIDASLPNFAGQPIVFSNITQTSVDVSFTSNDVLDKIEYSLDGQKTWVTVNSKEFTISSLKPYIDYTLYIRIRKASNKTTKTSAPAYFKTLPIYITDIIAENINVDVGSSATLNYSVLPIDASVKTLELKSNNNDIVGVNGDELFAFKKGTATITLLATDGSGIIKNIIASGFQRVEGITTNQTEMTLPKNASTELQYIILPSNASNKNVILTSSDESVVKVEGNTILGVENGNATVTVTTVDGNFKVDISVSVSGEYIWYDYSQPIEILNAIDIQHIKSNIIAIRSLLMAQGYDVELLKEMSAVASLPLGNIFDLLQNIEYNLDIINNFDIKSIYYNEPVNIGEYASNKEDIWRWVQILNDMYGILNGQDRKWQYLLLDDGFPTFEGKRILMRGEYIG